MLVWELVTSTDEIRRRTDPMLRRYWGLVIGKEGPNRVTNLFFNIYAGRERTTRGQRVCAAGISRGEK